MPHVDLPAITESRRLASPAPHPQALAVVPGGGCLYVTPRDVPLLYTIDVATHVVTAEVPLPGAAWGATIAHRVITYVASDGPADDRVIRTYDLDGDRHGTIGPCPEATGSYVAMHGGSLYLTQFYKRRLLKLNAAAEIVAETALPRDVCGVAEGPEGFYLMTTDDEDRGAYVLTRVGFGEDPAIEDVARVPFPARSLAWDGSHFWTSHREQSELVAFRRPA